MHLNTTPAPPPGKPCWRDMHELLRDHLPCQLIMLASSQELERRCQELAATHPRFREELPLVLQGEAARRQRLGGGLVVVHARHSEVA